mmetsp:Transcript_15867/g.31083  ORF Transcript_15867/g.31083 Transcript_15867/m.31083 type:complete len:277 (+) Transcript_15867:30-860(+)|eukprot:CAMPEP_0175139346 /NCGR_PEP_ID=MMETSP0087-20121206/10850_1 /TAXON_ID=136419 /ORGANISM="Unknown Unknown, Strain D1" /LENGTH=276 /DNA_ID=CAMNT_0016422343 /DNA_START=31 /DNA_END=861 /DNA_ORIENTATION=+
MVVPKLVGFCVFATTFASVESVSPQLHAVKTVTDLPAPAHPRFTVITVDQQERTFEAPPGPAVVHAKLDKQHFVYPSIQDPNKPAASTPLKPLLDVKVSSAVERAKQAVAFASAIHEKVQAEVRDTQAILKRDTAKIDSMLQRVGMKARAVKARSRAVYSRTLTPVISTSKLEHPEVESAPELVRPKIVARVPAAKPVTKPAALAFKDEPAKQKTQEKETQQEAPKQETPPHVQQKSKQEAQNQVDNKQAMDSGTSASFSVNACVLMFSGLAYFLS